MEQSGARATGGREGALRFVGLLMCVCTRVFVCVRGEEGEEDVMRRLQGQGVKLQLKEAGAEGKSGGGGSGRGQRARGRAGARGRGARGSGAGLGRGKK